MSYPFLSSSIQHFLSKNFTTLGVCFRMPNRHTSVKVPSGLELPGVPAPYFPTDDFYRKTLLFNVDLQLTTKITHSCLWTYDESVTMVPIRHKDAVLDGFLRIHDTVMKAIKSSCLIDRRLRQSRFLLDLDGPDLTVKLIDSSPHTFSWLQKI